MKKGIIFDMDGTLWDSAENVADSWNVVLQKKGMHRTLSKEDISRVMGLTMDKLAAGIFPEEPPERQLALMEECVTYENDYLREHGGVLYPALEDTLKLLKSKGFRLYIVSNCQSGYIECFLDHYGFWPLFEDMECFGNNGLPKGDNIRLVKERNGLDAACYVGDIQGDYDATVAAGLPFIHAAYGFGTVQAEVPRLSAFAELPGLIDSII